MAAVNLPRIDCSRGAPMGRPSYCDNPEARCTVFRIHLDSGGYDNGGAYWGHGEPIFGVHDRYDQVFLTYRAKSRLEASLKAQQTYPQLRITL